MRFTCLLAVPALLLCPVALAWGPSGHQAAGQIASAYLNPQARAAVQQILGEQSLAAAGLWADEVRSDHTYDWIKPLHYINVPRGADHVDLARDCPGGQCVAGAIVKYRDMLQNPQATPEEKLLALRLLVHFVEDIHQPMHVGYADDKGGNMITLTLLGKPTNLHAVWDSGIIENRIAGQGWKAWSDSLQQRITPEQQAAWAKDTDPTTWAAESLALVRAIYPALPANAALDQQYVDTNFVTVEERVQKAGVRLAAVLNQALGAAPAATQRAPVELLGTALLAADTQDASGLAGTLSSGGKTMPHNLLGSAGSGLAYSGAGNLYLAVADRGPEDGAFPFADRMHVLQITAEPKNVVVKPVRTALFRTPQGEQYIGSLQALDVEHPDRSMRLDPEGIAVSRNGTVWTAEEYGPFLDEWTPDGVHVQRVAFRPRFAPEHPSVDPDKEMPPHSNRGRQANRGPEGLAITPDGSRAYAILQSPLLQDSGVDASNKRVGTNIRIAEFVWTPEGSFRPGRELVYQLDSAANGVNEITAVGNDTFLVLEKDGADGEKAKQRTIYRIDLASATDVSGVESLPQTGLPKGFVAVRKTKLFDLLDPAFGLAGPTMPAKVEGLAFGPAQPDGRRTLIVASDNDYSPTEPTHVWAFSIDPAVLPGFAPQTAVLGAAGQPAGQPAGQLAR